MYCIYIVYIEFISIYCVYIDMYMYSFFLCLSSSSFLCILLFSQCYCLIAISFGIIKVFTIIIVPVVQALSCEVSRSSPHYSSATHSAWYVIKGPGVQQIIPFHLKGITYNVNVG